MTNVAAYHRPPATLADAAFLAGLSGNCVEPRAGEALLRVVLPQGEMPSSAVLAARSCFSIPASASIRPRPC